MFEQPQERSALNSLVQDTLPHRRSTVLEVEPCPVAPRSARPRAVDTTRLQHCYQHLQEELFLLSAEILSKIETDTKSSASSSLLLLNQIGVGTTPDLNQGDFTIQDFQSLRSQPCDYLQPQDVLDATSLPNSRRTACRLPTLQILLRDGTAIRSATLTGGISSKPNRPLLEHIMTFRVALTW